MKPVMICISRLASLRAYARPYRKALECATLLLSTALGMSLSVFTLIERILSC